MTTKNWQHLQHVDALSSVDVIDVLSQSRAVNHELQLFIHAVEPFALASIEVLSSLVLSNESLQVRPAPGV